VFDPDSTPNNNNPAEDDQASASVTPQQADLSLTKTASPNPAVAGQNLTYTLTLLNNGPTAASNVVVTDAVPANTTFVSATVVSGFGWSIASPPPGGTGNVVFSKSSVASGETNVLRVVVKVNTPLPPNTTITNTATVTSSTPDPNSANDSGAAATAVAQFDKCIRDDATGRVLRFNSTTGDYQYVDAGKGIKLTGRGVVTQSGCKMDLNAQPGKTGDSQHKVVASLNTCTREGVFDITPFNSQPVIHGHDNDVTNNNCNFP
ncbi:MAG TPA: DUF11 domain-containing protein, partial [Blastocatellia bacterium]|nr:DUF11 domain-containing protein [Blastocatellia bacterium]